MLKTRVRQENEGYVVVIKRNFEKYGLNTFIERYVNDFDEGVYNVQSLTRCDGITYALFDCKNKKLVY